GTAPTFRGLAAAPTWASIGERTGNIAAYPSHGSLSGAVTLSGANPYSAGYRNCPAKVTGNPMRTTFPGRHGTAKRRFPWLPDGRQGGADRHRHKPCIQQPGTPVQTVCPEDPHHRTGAGHRTVRIGSNLG